MEDKRTVEINGIKFEVDMRTATRVDQFKVGDNIKILDKSYKNEIMDGVIVDFLNFKDLPTIQVAYFSTGLFETTIRFININEETDKNYEILPSNPHELKFEKNKVVEKIKNEIDKKQEEANELQNKLDWFEKFYGKYFEKEDKNGSENWTIAWCAR